jgi:hypothetical protein
MSIAAGAIAGLWFCPTSSSRPGGARQMRKSYLPAPRDAAINTIDDVVSKTLGVPLSTFKALDPQPRVERFLAHRAEHRALWRPRFRPHGPEKHPRRPSIERDPAGIEQRIEALVLETGGLGDPCALRPVAQAGERPDELGYRDRRIVAQLEQDAVLESLERVPMDRRRLAGCPLRDRAGRLPRRAIPGQSRWQHEPGVGVEAGELVDQLDERVAIDHVRPNELDDCSRLCLDLDSRPLEVDPLLEPVDPQRDAVLDAMAGDRRDRFVAPEPERQSHDDLKGVALCAAIGRRIGLPARRSL